MRNLAACICIFIPCALFAQTKGTITIHDEAGAGNLVKEHIDFNSEHGELPGYRIQILSTSSLAEAKNVKAQFLSTFDIKAQIEFESPNYKVRVGNYGNRFDANSDLQEVLTFYPNAFIVKDLISIDE